MKKKQIVPIDLITPDPNQPRKTFTKEDIKALAHNMKLEGMIHPIEVDKSLKIIVGERRYKAAILLKWKEVEVTVNLKKLSPYQRLRRQMSENLFQSAAKSGEAMPSEETAEGWAALYELKEGRPYSPGEQGHQYQKGVSGQLPGPLAKIIDEVGASKTTAWEVLQILGEPGYVRRALRPNKVFKKGMPRTFIREANKAPLEIRDKIKKKMVKGEYASRDELMEEIRLAKKYPEMIPAIILRDRKNEPPEIKRITSATVRLVLALEAQSLEKMPERQRNVVRNQLYWVQEEMEKYLIEDITPVEDAPSAS